MSWHPLSGIFEHSTIPPPPPTFGRFLEAKQVGNKVLGAMINPRAMSNVYDGKELMSMISTHERSRSTIASRHVQEHTCTCLWGSHRRSFSV